MNISYEENSLILLPQNDEERGDFKSILMVMETYHGVDIIKGRAYVISKYNDGLRLKPADSESY